MQSRNTTLAFCPDTLTAPAAADCASMAALRALDRAGLWLLHRGSRGMRGRLSAVPTREVHCHIPADPERLDEMLDGAYRELDAVLPDARCLRAAVDAYVRSVLASGSTYNPDELRCALDAAECTPAADGEEAGHGAP